MNLRALIIEYHRQKDLLTEELETIEETLKVLKKLYYIEADKRTKINKKHG